MAYRIGIDLGGTNLRAGLLDESCQLVARRSIPTEAQQGPDHVISRMAQAARALAQDASLAWPGDLRIGVGTPGPLGPGGVVLTAPNLPGWVNVPLATTLTNCTGCPVTVANDANAAAYGEYLAGAGRGYARGYMILVTLGTGLGGGILLDGQIYQGAHGAGAELGHVIVEPEGLPCGCGQRGCIEQYASASAVATEAQRRLEAGAASALRPHPSCRDVFVAAEAGDELAKEVVDRAVAYLALACVGYVRCFDPELIVLGGGMARAGDALLERVRRAFAERTWTVREERVQFVAAELGDDAGVMGAALLADDCD